MANFRENKKNGKVISFRFIVCLERDVRGKQIRKYTTWTAPADLTPAKARKAAERAADSPDALQNGGTELPHSFPRKDHGRALRIRRRRKAQRRGHRVRLRRASDLPRYLANAGDRPHQRVCHRVAAQYIQHGAGIIRHPRGHRLLRGGYLRRGGSALRLRGHDAGASPEQRRVSGYRRSQHGDRHI